MCMCIYNVRMYAPISRREATDLFGASCLEQR